MNWTDLRGLIEGEAVVLLGKDRVHAKASYAEIDARGSMRNEPLHDAAFAEERPV